MGFLDTIASATGQGENAQVATGLIEEVKQQPGGIGSILDSFRQNGMEETVKSWATGASQAATPDQVETGLGGTGIIERVAARAGVSPEIVKIALSTVLPYVIKHFTNQEGQPESPGGLGGMASSVLGKFL